MAFWTWIYSLLPDRWSSATSHVLVCGGHQLYVQTEHMQNTLNVPFLQHSHHIYLQIMSSLTLVNNMKTKFTSYSTCQRPSWQCSTWIVCITLQYSISNVVKNIAMYDIAVQTVSVYLRNQFMLLRNNTPCVNSWKWSTLYWEPRKILPWCHLEMRPNSILIVLGDNSSDRDRRLTAIGQLHSWDAEWPITLINRGLIKSPLSQPLPVMFSVW